MEKGLYIYKIVAIIFGIYCIIVHITKKDFLNEIIFNSPIIHKLFGEKCCSIWPASHFIMYSIIGYVSPKYFYLWFLLGILWELFEFCIGNTFYKDKIKKNNDIKFEYGDIWMNGSFKDILFNTLGLMFGIFIHNIVNKKY